MTNRRKEIADNIIENTPMIYSNAKLYDIEELSIEGKLIISQNTWSSFQPLS